MRVWARRKLPVAATFAVEADCADFVHRVWVVKMRIFEGDSVRAVRIGKRKGIDGVGDETDRGLGTSVLVIFTETACGVSILESLSAVSWRDAF